LLFPQRRSRKSLKTSDVSPAIEKIESQAEFSRKHIEGIAFNTDRRVTDQESWYIGMVRGRQLSLEWALRELKGESHDGVTEKMLADGIEEALFGVEQF
jgi:hypothetical protein